MARELVPIKILIGLDENGHHSYPNFNVMPCIRISNMDWSKYVDVHGTGWVYDRKCGHKSEDETSPYGYQWGMLLVPKQFAVEALKHFPNSVREVSEQECCEFYETRAMADAPEERIDEKILQGIYYKLRIAKELGQEYELTDAEKSALDPDQDQLGIRKNKVKTFEGYKSEKAFVCVHSGTDPDLKHPHE